MRTGYQTPTGMSRETVLQAIRQGFEDAPSALELWGLAGFVTLIGGLALFAWRKYRTEECAAPPPKPNYLALALDRLNLNETVRRDVLYVSQRAGLKHPAAMLLSPANLSRATQIALRETPDPALLQRMDQLCRQLFSAPLPRAAPGPSAARRPQT